MPPVETVMPRNPMPPLSVRVSSVDSIAGTSPSATVETVTTLMVCPGVVCDISCLNSEMEPTVCSVPSMVMEYRNSPFSSPPVSAGLPVVMARMYTPICTAFSVT